MGPKLKSRYWKDPVLRIPVLRGSTVVFKIVSYNPIFRVVPQGSFSRFSKLVFEAHSRTHALMVIFKVFSRSYANFRGPVQIRIKFFETFSFKKNFFTGFDNKVPFVI